MCKRMLFSTVYYKFEYTKSYDQHTPIRYRTDRLNSLNYPCDSAKRTELTRTELNRTENNRKRTGSRTKTSCSRVLYLATA